MVGDRRTTSLSFPPIARTFVFLCILIQPNRNLLTPMNPSTNGPSNEPWGRSKCTRAQLASFEEAGILHAGRWRIPAAGEVTPYPRGGEFVCFTSHLELGLG